jgi:nicotinamidase-related amidase
MGKTAFLVMDVQNGIVARFAAADALQPLQSAVQTARAHALPVIFVRVALRPGYREVSPHNRAFASLKEQGGLLETDAATQVWDGVRPAPDEVVVIKRRVSAFTGSDLEVVLRAQAIDQLILTGIATSGVVLSTLREAADRDYQLTVLSDACLDADPEVHRVLMEKVFPRQAQVLTVTGWQATLPDSTDGTIRGTG